MKYLVKNWDHFQHYRDRNPPWIKLHFELLCSSDWVMLDDASRVLAIACMLIASRSKGEKGEIDGSEAGLAYLKRVAYLNKPPNLKPLILCGFLVPASGCKQMLANARPETETETETETDNTSLFGKKRAASILADSNGWGNPEALVALYNADSPDECPAVDKLTLARRKKAKLYLAQFPDRQFWCDAFKRIHESTFLRGLKPQAGHEHFRASLDWLLTKGKDGVENVVKTWEGRYSDG